MQQLNPKNQQSTGQEWDIAVESTIGLTHPPPWCCAVPLFLPGVHCRGAVMPLPPLFSAFMTPTPE